METSLNGIRRFNVIAGFLHLVSMVGVLALSNSFSLPLNATYMSGPPGTTFEAPVTIINTPIGLVVALFLGISAAFHFIVASPMFFSRYQSSLLKNKNIFRWVEY